MTVFKINPVFSHMTWDENGRAYQYNQCPFLEQNSTIWSIDFYNKADVRVREAAEYYGQCPGQWNQVIIYNPEFVEIPDGYNFIVWQYAGSAYATKEMPAFDLVSGKWIIPSERQYIPELSECCPSSYKHCVITAQEAYTIQLVHDKFSAKVLIHVSGIDLVEMDSWEKYPTLGLYREFVNAVYAYAQSYCVNR